MATQTDLIAGQIVALTQAVSGAPALVEWRKEEAFHPTRGAEPVGGVVVSGPTIKPAQRYFGKIQNMEYSWQVAWFFPDTATPIAGDDTRPTFFRALKTALSVCTLSGTLVWDFEIAERPEWEGQRFAQGLLVSRFGIMYRTNETW